MKLEQQPSSSAVESMDTSVNCNKMRKNCNSCGQYVEITCCGDKANCQIQLEQLCADCAKANNQL